MKKILSLILAIMMMVSVFSGCSEEKPEENNEIKENESEIVVSALQKSFTAVVYDDGENEEFWNNVKTSFENSNQGVTINLIFSKDAAYEVRDRILSGNSPDFVYLPSDEETGVTEALIKDKALTELTDIESSAPDADIFENNICKPYEDGKSYLAPIFFEQKGLIYNIELLSENGFSEPKTWNDFISIAEACKNKNFEFFTYAGAEPDEFVDIFASAIVNESGISEAKKLFDYDENAWENTTVTTFAEKIESITKLVVSGSSTKTKEDTMELLEEGEVLFISGTSADLKNLNKDGEKYGICAYPALVGNPFYCVSFSEMYIPVEAKEAELAKQFMTFLYSDEVLTLASELLGKMKVENGSAIFAVAFAEKSAANETLSDEFCALVVDIFKGNIKADDFSDKMIEYIKEY